MARDPAETVILQSFRANDVPAWLHRCQRSVQDWAALRGHTYRFLGDELFDALPPRFRLRTGHLPQVMADLGRLLAIRELLRAGHHRVAWIDFDVLVCAPDQFTLPEGSPHLLCREVWVVPTADGISVEDRVNNCVCVFTERSTLLPFYIDACAQIVDETVGALHPLAIGTRFLTALDRAVPLPKLESVALLSPYVLREVAEARTGPLVDAMRARMRGPIEAVNLCASFRTTIGRPPGQPSFEIDDALFGAAVDRLLAV